MCLPGAVIWKSVKQKCIADSTMEAEYVAASETAKEAVWLKNFLLDLGVWRDQVCFPSFSYVKLSVSN